MGTTNHDILRASKLIGHKVVNLQGDDLGKIEDIVLDPSSGNVQYAVLSFGGFLGMGDKLFALPWHAMTFDRGDHKILVDLSKDRLENAPGFDKDHWPSDSGDYYRRVDDYYTTAEVATR